MIEIDGSYGEGGGQIIRTVVALSAITGKPCVIKNIRSGRPNPGLQAQHLEAVKAVAKLCNGNTDAKLGATDVTFEPDRIEGGHFNINIGTAGAISLIIQAVSLPAIHAESPVNLRIVGGTHVRWSPSMDYMQNIFCYYMKKLGIDFIIDVEKHGFFPKGGGRVTMQVTPCNPGEIELTETGKLVETQVFSIATEDLRSREVAERQITGVERFVAVSKKSVKYVQAESTGSAVHVQRVYENCILGASGVGDKNVSAIAVGEAAGHELKNQSGCVDKHMTDQLLPFLAFAPGSRIQVSEITEHARTNIWAIEQFLPVKFIIDEKKKIISVDKK